MTKLNPNQILLYSFITLSLFLLEANVFGQFPVLKRQERVLKKADVLFQQKDYSKAIIKYRDYISRYEGTPDIYFKLATAYKDLGQPERAETYYKKVINSNDEANPIVHLALGQVLMTQGKYEDARSHFLKYNELLEYNDQMAMRYISSIENRDKYFTDTAFFTEENLPINSKSADFGATALDKSFYFLSTRNRKDDYNERYSSDLFVTNKEGDKIFEVPKRISGPANTRFGEIGYAIVPESNEIFICRYEPGKQNDYSLGYKLYKAFIGADNEITRPVKFELEKFKYAIAYPTLSRNGKFMVFASDAPGGYGGWDLYKADYSSTGIDNVQNLGEKVNSAGDELYPFLLNDSILFFATDGHGGLGGFDIYSKNLIETGEYATNLGSPINSAANDYAVYFDSGLSGYFTSNREGGMGNDDIYRFTIHQLKLSGEIIDEANGENLKNVNVKVSRSTGNKEALALADNGNLTLVAQPGEKIEITIEKDGYETRSFTVNTSDMTFVGNHSVQIGKLPVVKIVQKEPVAIELGPEIIEKKEVPNIFFSVQLASSRSKISKRILKKKYSGPIDIIEFYDGKYYRYLLGKYNSYFLAKEVWLPIKSKKVFLVSFKDGKNFKVMKALKEAHVEPAEAKDPEVHAFLGKTEQVSSELIYYGLDKFRIPDENAPELTNIVKALEENPNYFLEIAAHTDKRGSDMYNRALSEERAKFLDMYFVDHGISKKRIIYHGIGEKQLKNYCVDCSENEHKQNRRAELILRQYKEKE